MAEGPERGLAFAEQLADEPALARYPELAAVRGTFLQQLGRLDEAREQFLLAARQTTNATQRRLYLDQADTCAGDDSGGDMTLRRPTTAGEDRGVDRGGGRWR